MQSGKRYTLFQTLNWMRTYIFIFIIYDAAHVTLYYFTKWEWLHMPWQPLSLIGIAVAFYLGFKNNSSYERLWEARKIWGGIVNASRSFAVMAKNFINADTAQGEVSEGQLKNIRKTIVHRHVAWLHALVLQMRKVMEWEHNSKHDRWFRKLVNSDYSEEKFDNLKNYLSEQDFKYVMTKGNRASHILSVQTSHLMELRQKGLLEHFRHLEMQNLITEFYTLQGKSERIKNFPFPRQYATVIRFFIVLFIILLPFGMLDVFTQLPAAYWIWLAIPFSVISSWVFWMMEMIGEYSENPFEGLHNDVPIKTIATGIEIDIRQMLDEEDLPEAPQPEGRWRVLI